MRGGAAGVGWTDCGMAFISSVSIVGIGFNFLAAKNGAFVHHGNILVTAKMVICVSVAKIKLHTAVIKYKIYFLSSRGNHDRDVISAVTE